MVGRWFGMVIVWCDNGVTCQKVRVSCDSDVLWRQYSVRTVSLCFSGWTLTGTNLGGRMILIRFMTIRWYSPKSPVFCTGQNSGTECDGSHHPCNFRALDSAKNRYSPSENAYYFWFTIFCRQKQFSWLLLGLSYYLSWSLQGHETNMGILPAAGYVHSNYAFGSQRNNHKIGSEIQHDTTPS